MTDTTKLALPYIDAAQQQKHVTHNDGLRILDAVIHLSVIDRNRVTPPGAPAEGARYHVGTSATGAFLAQDGRIAAWQDGAWRFLIPRAGWRMFVEAENLLLGFDGTLWKDIGAFIKALNNLDLLGVGTTADVTNPLSAKLNAALLVAKTVAETGTGDLRVKFSKEAALKTVSQLYQTNFSGRAETGLMGDDRFRIKVSNDGATWFTALDIDPANGRVAFPSGAPGLSLKRVDTLTASGSYTRQSVDAAYLIRMIGGGGGGGGGCLVAAATACSGGGGGGGAAHYELWVDASDLVATTSFTIGAGGTAGAAAATSTTAGANGGTGGTTAFGALGVAGGGGGGAGGQIAATASGGGGGGTSGTSATVLVPGGLTASGATGGASGSFGAAGGSGAAGNSATVAGTGAGGSGCSAAGAPSAGAAAYRGCGSGGSGGGLTAAGASNNGGLGGFSAMNANVRAAAGTSGTPAGAAAATPSPSYLPGGGGGGGYGNGAGAGGSGGVGVYGGGGGGGGAALNGSTAGAGAAGGAGRIVIYVYG